MVNFRYCECSLKSSLLSLLILLLIGSCSPNQLKVEQRKRLSTSELPLKNHENRNSESYDLENDINKDVIKRDLLQTFEIAGDGKNLKNSSSSLALRNHKTIFNEKSNEKSNEKTNEKKVLTKPPSKNIVSDISVPPTPQVSSIVEVEKWNPFNLIEKGIYPTIDYPVSLKESDKKALPLWKKFKLDSHPGEKIELNIKYLGISCGTIFLEEKPSGRLQNRDVRHFFGRLKSAEFYENFYKVDDYLESYVDKTYFTPIKYTLVQRETKQSVDDLQLFNNETLINSYWYKQEKNGETKKEHIDITTPYLLQDSFAALYFIRGLPLQKGESYEIPVVTRGSLWTLKVMVQAEESIEIGGMNYNAVRIAAETHFPGVLKKKGDIVFWFTRDKNHLPLKFLAKVKIGKIEGELGRYQLGQ